MGIAGKARMLRNAALAFGAAIVFLATSVSMSFIYGLMVVPLAGLVLSSLKCGKCGHPLLLRKGRFFNYWSAFFIPDKCTQCGGDL